jgi:hypothetical protein
MSNFDNQGWQPQGSTATVPQESKKKGPIQKVRGVVEWAELTRKNQFSDKYQFVLTQLSEEAVKALADKLGVTSVKNSPERGNYITIKSNFVIQAFNEHDSEIDDMIGNGTKAVVALGSYTNSYGTWPTLVRLTITDLVHYERPESENSEAEIF